MGLSPASRDPREGRARPRDKEVEENVLSRYVRLLLPARQSGQGLVEYALILVLVAIVVIGVLSTMGKSITAAFTDIVGSLGGGG
jgi:pilus assembly protein Flp/PilA